MIKHINFNEFCDSFSGTYKDNFSYEGKKTLFEYLEEIGKYTGNEIELDTIALFCEYTEYKDLKALQADYTNIKSMEELRDNTQVIEIPNSEAFIILQF